MKVPQFHIQSDLLSCFSFIAEEMLVYFSVSRAACKSYDSMRCFPFGCDKDQSKGSQSHLRVRF